MSTDLKLGIDARAARKGSADFVSALNSIKRAMGDLSRETDGALKQVSKSTAKAGQAAATSISAAVRKAESDVGTLNRQLNKVGDARGLAKVDSALAQFRAEAERGTISATELAAAKERLAQSLHEVRQGVRDALEIQRLETAYHRTAAAFGEAETGAAAYRRAQMSVDQALRSGVISQQRANDVLAHAKTHYLDAANAAQRAHAANGRLFGSMAGWGQNFDARGVSMQLSQVAQQGAVTGDYIRALMVQLPDLALGFGPVGIAVGALAGSLGTVLAPAISTAIFGGEGLEEKFKDLSEALTALEEVSGVTSDQIAQHITQSFGDSAKAVNDLVQALRTAEFEAVTRKVAGSMESATSVLGKLQTEWSNWQTFGAQGSKEIIDATGLSEQAFRDLQAAVADVSKSSDVDSLITRIANVRDLASEVGGPIGDAIRDAMTAAASEAGILAKVTADAKAEVSAAATEADKLRQGLSDGAVKALELAGVNIASGISDATKEAAELASQLNIGLTAALNIRNARRDLDSGVSSGRGDPRFYGLGNGGTTGTDTGTVFKPVKIQSPKADPVSSIDRTTESLKLQNIAYQALASGIVETETAARMLAEASLDGTLTNAELEAVRAADAIAKANDQLAKIVSTQNQSSDSLRKQTGDALTDGLRDGLRGVMKGDTDNLASNIANTVRDKLANALADQAVSEITKLLGLATLQPAAHSAGTTIHTQMVTAGTIAAQQIGAAMTSATATGGGSGDIGKAIQIGAQIMGGGETSTTTTGDTGSSGGSSKSEWLLLAAKIGLAMFGVPTFKEGGFSDDPHPWANAPHYAEGTPNTSGGIPAVLHPNEAVVPLSRGRKIPVEGGGGGPTIGDVHMTTNVTLEGSDAGPQDAERLAKHISETLSGRIQHEIVVALGYGGVANPRGGLS